MGVGKRVRSRWDAEITQQLANKMTLAGREFLAPPIRLTEWVYPICDLTNIIVLPDKILPDHKAFILKL